VIALFWLKNGFEGRDEGVSSGPAINFAQTPKLFGCNKSPALANFSAFHSEAQLDSQLSVCGIVLCAAFVAEGNFGHGVLETPAWHKQFTGFPKT